MTAAMLYKEWPERVFLKQEGRYWFIMRLVKYRGEMVDDALESDVVPERLETVLRERGYSPDPASPPWWQRPPDPPRPKPRPWPKPKRRRTPPEEGVVI